MPQQNNSPDENKRIVRRFVEECWNQGSLNKVTPCCGSINDSGEAVGFSVDGATGNLRAFVWQNGVMTDLNSLIPADSPLYLLTAEVINSQGEIAGLSLTNTGEVHGFLAKPI